MQSFVPEESSEHPATVAEREADLAARPRWTLDERLEAMERQREKTARARDKLAEETAEMVRRGAPSRRISFWRPPRQKAPKRPNRKARRQKARAEFVRKHKLACFVCGGKGKPWAKTGTNRVGPWAICLPCVKSNRESA